MSDSDSQLTKEVSRYVSNLNGDIYTVSNIPEEVIAVIFAYVSRSPRGFRENIGTVIHEEQLGQERASKFHEKWVLNYGHASVAEHAAIHVGIENVSRLFSSVLELSNEYLSFTEYSQRYQKPVRGDFYTPTELKRTPGLLREFQNTSNRQYDIYLELNEKLLEHLKNTVPVTEGKDDKAHYRALEKVAFEDARYALNLSTHTNLGMTGNARAIEDSLTKLLSSRYSEVRTRAEEIKKEVRFSAPTLVKYANENAYLRSSNDLLEQLSARFIGDVKTEKTEGPSVSLLNFTGKNSDDPELDALFVLSKAALYLHSEASANEIERRLSGHDKEELLVYFDAILSNLGKHDNPIEILRLVEYDAEFIISEACWHQLLRHRKTNWTVKDPSVNFGVTIPPNVREAGVSDLLYESINIGEEMYYRLIESDLTDIAPYAVTNAHNRRVTGSFDLWELYHLINLRMSEGAQWDIKQTITQLSEKISWYHPNLVSPALERVS